MAGPSDHELTAEIAAGRRDALGLLFDRYGSSLYEFIYYITGDRDRSVRLLEQVFARIPSLIPGLGETESIRSWLYGLARDASLFDLRQDGWLDSLPAPAESVISGLGGDIWRAARAMPATLRAALIVEELHGLSPTEKARVLDVPRGEVPGLVEQARAAFNARFDEQARLQGRPAASQVEPEHYPAIRRRLPSSGTLFGYLPTIWLSEPQAEQLRAQIVGHAYPVERAAAPAPVLAPAPPPFVPQEPAYEPPGQYTQPAPSRILPEGCSLPVILGALFIALIVTAVVAFIGFSFVRDTSAPIVAKVEPADKSTVPVPAGATTARVILTATFRDDRAVNPRTIRLLLDGEDVTAQAVISNAGVSYPTDLGPGQHTAYLEVYDTSNNRGTMMWQFTVMPPVPPTGTPTLTPLPTATSTSTPRPSPTGTPPPPTITNFSASLTSVRPGTAVTLSWTVTNAETVFLNTDRVDLTGSRVFTPTVTTTYRLIASNAGGTSDRQVTVTVAALPDLTVSEISVSPAGQVSYTIKNIGSGDVTQMFLIQVLADSAPIDSNRRIASLPAGQEATLSVPNYVLLGTHVVTVRVNGGQEIPEASFSNNDLTRTLVGPTPTPTITTTATRTATVPATNTPTRTPTLAPVTTVTATLTSVTPYTGTCPANASFSGAITTSGATTVMYQWERSNGTAVGPFTLNFASAGSGTVTDAWSNVPVGTVWERLRILTPNDMVSPQVQFTNSCH